MTMFKQMCYNIKGDEMKKNEYINVRIDAETKTKAEDILKNFNLRISDAINIFLRQVVLEEGIPFEVKLPQYEKAYKALEKAVAYNAFGGGIPSDYANNILKLYAKNLIDFDTAVFALNRKIT